MYGSEKQVSWAKDIISDVMGTVETMRSNASTMVECGLAPAEFSVKVNSALDEFCSSLNEYTHASDVINDRDVLKIRLAKMVKRAID